MKTGSASYAQNTWTSTARSATTAWSASSAKRATLASTASASAASRASEGTARLARRVAAMSAVRAISQVTDSVKSVASSSTAWVASASNQAALSAKKVTTSMKAYASRAPRQFQDAVFASQPTCVACASVIISSLTRASASVVRRVATSSQMSSLERASAMTDTT